MPANTSHEGNRWYDTGLSFTCSQCGHCCTVAGYVWVTEREIREISHHLDLDESDFALQYLRQVHHEVSLVEKPNRECIFWDEGCSIYPVRPSQCRTFPFWTENLRSRKAWDRTSKECPGCDQGRRYSREEIDALRAGDGQTRRSRARGSCH